MEVIKEEEYQAQQLSGNSGGCGQGRGKCKSEP